MAVSWTEIVRPNEKKWWKHADQARDQLRRLWRHSGRLVSFPRCSDGFDESLRLPQKQTFFGKCFTFLFCFYVSGEEDDDDEGETSSVSEREEATAQQAHDTQHTKDTPSPTTEQERLSCSSPGVGGLLNVSSLVEVKMECSDGDVDDQDDNTSSRRRGSPVEKTLKGECLRH